MIGLGKGIVRFRIPILILCVLLLIPSVVGMLNIRINYDMLDYLPEDIDTDVYKRQTRFCMNSFISL